ncbi:hypothetical protein CANCADRAFT_42705 [Tortispora caseinolytica NRRL Y-17796]|uniref:Endoplasmic reticulum junction formation protein lunapark n=1 Tax=Tortispora caseinolytica NRRL Y-17796 TaxID=767744 RepID=A0A1E4TK28_9ASCO|nr:hypothetical protein CANCADRAFT_42705 [Tortispora caseinolytica NRRL Y-17796]
MGFIRDNESYNSKPVLLRIMTTIMGPMLIYLGSRTLNFFFSNLINRADNKAKRLNKDIHKKIEELKSSTKFYSTQELLNRFGDDEQAKDLRKRRAELEKQEKLLKERQLRIKEFNVGRTVAEHWYDRLLENLIGVSDTSPNSRYALICQNCYHHNGLAMPGQNPKNIKFVCRNCKTLNPVEQPSESCDEGHQTVRQDSEGTEKDMGFGSRQDRDQPVNKQVVSEPEPELELEPEQHELVTGI